MRRALVLVVSLAAAAASAQSVPETALAQSVPETDYVLQCRGCHGPEGTGVPGHVPSLAAMGELLATPAGRARLLAVPGVRQASLSDERLAALLTWAAERFSPEPALFAPLAPDEVSRLRRRVPEEVSRLR